MSTGKKVNELWDCDVEDAILWLENKPLYIFIDAIEFIADCGDNAFTLLQEIYRLADKYSNVYIITSCRTTDSSAFMKINTNIESKHTIFRIWRKMRLIRLLKVIPLFYPYSRIKNIRIYYVCHFISI